MNKYVIYVKMRLIAMMLVIINNVKIIKLHKPDVNNVNIIN